MTAERTHQLIVLRGEEVVLAHQFVVNRSDNPVMKGVAPSSPKAAPAAAPRQFTNSVTMTLVRIEPGSFTMGSNDGPDDEKPTHSVRAAGSFHLGTHERTRGPYKAMMGETLGDPSGVDDLPVEHVSWLEAVAFCNTLSMRAGRTPGYLVDGNVVTRVADHGYRLPTEAEWEYACRAGTTTNDPFGDDDADPGESAWFDGNAENQSHPVGQKRPNPRGLHDMLGTAWEWRQDGYDATYHEKSPPGPSGTTSRVLRGGGWLGLLWSCRPAYRGMSTPNDRSRNLSFRVATTQAGFRGAREASRGAGASGRFAVG